MRHPLRSIPTLLTSALIALLARVPSAVAAKGPLFATSDRCLACHNGMTLSTGEDVSIGFAWRASVMANAARDPYWQAAVRREVIDHPGSSTAIQDECAACHMPMARFEARTAGGKAQVFPTLGPEGRQGGPDPFATDGVSCSVCHQLRNGGPALEQNGELRIDTDRPWGERRVLGPYDIPVERARVMHSASGFLPERASNLERSELCSTCHTLYTLNDAGPGKPRVRFPEQVPYLEWRASAYAREKTCQACHMTFTAEPAPAASVLGEARPRFARHGFQGANFFMLGMLERFRAELGVAALPQELSLSRQRTLELLQTSAATLSIAQRRFAMGASRWPSWSRTRPDTSCRAPTLRAAPGCASSSPIVMGGGCSRLAICAPTVASSATTTIATRSPSSRTNSSSTPRSRCRSTSRSWSMRAGA